MIKSTDKGSLVVVWDREDYIKDAGTQLSDEEIYEEVFNDTAPLLKTINTVIVKIRKRGELKRDNLEYFTKKDPNSQGFVSYVKFIKGYIMSQLSQKYLIVVTILKIFPYFWTIIYNHDIIYRSLYVKPADGHQYLQSSLCRPFHCKKGIPHSQDLRLNRICSDIKYFDKRCNDLERFLLERGYSYKLMRKEILLS